MEILLLAIIAGLLAIQLIYNIFKDSSELGGLAGTIAAVLGLTMITAFIGLIIAGGMGSLLEMFGVYL